MPLNQRCVKSNRVFKIECNNTVCARLVDCGYSQIPGVDFTSNYSPVVNDVTFRLLHLAIIVFGLTGQIALRGHLCMANWRRNLHGTSTWYVRIWT